MSGNPRWPAFPMESLSRATSSRTMTARCRPRGTVPGAWAVPMSARRKVPGPMSASQRVRLDGAALGEGEACADTAEGRGDPYRIRDRERGGGAAAGSGGEGGRRRPGIGRLLGSGARCRRCRSGVDRQEAHSLQLLRTPTRQSWHPDARPGRCAPWLWPEPSSTASSWASPLKGGTV